MSANKRGLSAAHTATPGMGVNTKKPRGPMLLPRPTPSSSSSSSMSPPQQPYQTTTAAAAAAATTGGDGDFGSNNITGKKRKTKKQNGSFVPKAKRLQRRSLPTRTTESSTGSDDDDTAVEELETGEKKERSFVPKKARLQRRSLPTRATSKNTEDRTLIYLTPTKRDAVFGSGGIANQIRIGSLYQSLLNTHFAEYSTLRQASKDEFVSSRIIQPILQEGGRFLELPPKVDVAAIAKSETRDKKTRHYYLYDPVEHRAAIARTIKQALRDKLKAATGRLNSRRVKKTVPLPLSSFGAQSHTECTRGHNDNMHIAKPKQSPDSPKMPPRNECDCQQNTGRFLELDNDSGAGIEQEAANEPTVSLVGNTILF